MVEFDRSLPVQHRYLGRNRQDVGGRVFVQGNQVLQVPVLLVKKLVVIPYETIPLTLASEAVDMLGQRMKQMDANLVFPIVNPRTGVQIFCPKVIGFVNRKFSDTFVREVDWIGYMGTLVEIFQTSLDQPSTFSDDEDEDHEQQQQEEIDDDIDIEEQEEQHMIEDEQVTETLPNQIEDDDVQDFSYVTLLGRGRARFKVESVIYEDVVYLVGVVRVLPDEIPNPIPSCVVQRQSYTPKFAYEQMDAKRLCRRALKLGRRLLWPVSESDDQGGNDSASVHKLYPQTYEDTVEFSYWLTRNMPLASYSRQKLLETDSVVMRLHKLVQLLSRVDQKLVCSRCLVKITQTRHVTALSTEGSTGNYVNPNGVLHQILTVSNLEEEGIERFGNPETRHSYFPGYSWTIIHCRCYNHLGWEFLAVNPDLQPARFYGLVRENITAL